MAFEIEITSYLSDMTRERYLNRINDTSKLLKTSSRDYLTYKSFLPDLKQAIIDYGKGKVLDIGCGNKPYKSWFNNIEAYTGVDIVQSSLNRVDILCEASKIPLGNAQFDTVFCTQVIEHLEDYQGMIDEAFRLLNKGGNIILSGPFYWHIHEKPYDFYRFTEYGFRCILEKSGFKVLDVKANGGAWATLGLMINHTLFFNNPKSSKSIKFIKLVFQKLKLQRIVNKIFSYLDKKDYNTINAINYVVVAKKEG